MKFLGPSGGIHRKSWELLYGLVFGWDIHEIALGVFFRWWTVGGKLHNVSLSVRFLCFSLEYYHFWHSKD